MASSASFGTAGRPFDCISSTIQRAGCLNRNWLCLSSLWLMAWGGSLSSTSSKQAAILSSFSISFFCQKIISELLVRRLEPLLHYHCILIFGSPSMTLNQTASRPNSIHFSFSFLAFAKTIYLVFGSSSNTTTNSYYLSAWAPYHWIRRRPWLDVEVTL